MPLIHLYLLVIFLNLRLVVFDFLLQLIALSLQMLIILHDFVVLLIVVNQLSENYLVGLCLLIKLVKLPAYIVDFLGELLLFGELVGILW